MKRCTKCGEEKSLTEYHRQKGRSDGRRDQCKECRKAGSREYYEAHTAERIAYEKRRRAENREAYCAAKARRYAALPPEKKAEQYRRKRANIAARPELNRAHQAAYRARSADSIRQRGRDYVADLTPWYVRSTLFYDIPAPSQLPIPRALIDAKREQLRIHRHLRKEKP